MNKILNEKEAFEIAKKSVIEELENKYDEYIELINTKEVEREVVFIKFKLGIFSEKEYKTLDNKLLEEQNKYEQGSSNMLSKIKNAKEILY